MHSIRKNNLSKNINQKKMQPKKNDKLTINNSAKETKIKDVLDICLKNVFITYKRRHVETFLTLVIVSLCVPTSQYNLKEKLKKKEKFYTLQIIQFIAGVLVKL